MVVDVSNIVRDLQLPGCSPCCWDRVELVLNAWRDQIDPDAAFYLVIDTRSAKRLGTDCIEKYRRASRAGDVREYSYADPEILSFAEQTAAAVLTGDYYRDERRKFPWVDGNTDRFFHWRFQSGVAKIVPRTMGIPTEFSKSRAEERTELKGLGADLSIRDVQQGLTNSYRCDNRDCWRHQFSPDLFIGIPDLTEPLSPRCSTCGSQLVMLGETGQVVQLKLWAKDSDSVRRVTLTRGQSVVVGRATEPKLIAELLGQDAHEISRRHAIIEWDGTTLRVADLGSKNGTSLLRWEQRTRCLQAPETVTDSTDVGPRDQISLAAVLNIQRSGRKYYLEASQALESTSLKNSRTQAQGSGD